MDAAREQNTPLTSSHDHSPPTPSKDSSTEGNRRSCRPRFLFTWYQELLACIAFIAALTALFVTLQLYRDKPTPDWPDWLSINSIISIYMVLLKSCVLLVAAEGLGQLKWSWFVTDPHSLYDLARYDHATRGPWGSAKLIWRLKFRHLAASLGALVTLLTLLVDPAVQQIVRFEECQTPLNGTRSSVPRTEVWYGNGNRLGPGIESMDPEVKRAISAGVAGSFAPLRADCLTGNCTWASQYTSLGWSGFCDDISEEIDYTNETYIGGPSNRTLWEARWSIPGGLSVPQGYNGSGPPYIKYAGMGNAPRNTSLPTGGVAFDFILAASSLHGETNVDPTTGQPWSDCDENDPGPKEWKCRGYGAARCYIFPSVKSYNATVQSGQLEESVTDADNVWGSGDGITIHTVDTHCISPSERDALIASNYSIDPNERWLAYNPKSEDTSFNLPVNDTFPDSLMTHGCQYAYWKPSVDSIQDYLVSIFWGYVEGIMVTVGVDSTSLEGSEAVQTIYNFGNVSFERVNDTFVNLAQALDDHVRLSGNTNFSNPALGQVMQEKTCIRIRWAWMAYPAALVVLALVFFGLMAVETWPRGVLQDVWKSSPLPLLYHGLWQQEEDAVGMPKLEKLKEMEDVARRTVVRLTASTAERSGLGIA